MPRNILVYFLNMEIALFVLKVLQCESVSSDQIHFHKKVRSDPSTESFLAFGDLSTESLTF